MKTRTTHLDIVIILVLTNFFLPTSMSQKKIRRKDYSGYQVHRVNVNSSDHQTLLQTLFQLLEADVWKEPTQFLSHFDVMIPGKSLTMFKDALRDLNLSYSLRIRDVQVLIDDEHITHGKRHPRRTRRFRFNQYNDYSTIIRFMKYFRRANSDIVSVVQVGITYEGRKIFALKISEKSDRVKPVIWQDALIHAREWVTGSTMLWVANRMVQGYRKGETDSVQLIRNFDWLLVPVWNVDGYLYTWKEDRLWRKSRSESGSMGCRGVDLNRNFLTPNRGGGTSSNYICSGVYQGTTAFSEPETETVSQYLKTLNLAAFISVHSFSQLWMFPFGYTKTHSPDYSDLDFLSDHAVRAIYDLHGVTYQQGPVVDMIYKVSGGSVDWAHEKLCVKYAFAVELRDRGEYGFLLPKEDLIPTAEEYFAALKTVGRHLMTTNSTRSSLCNDAIG
ncbi:carboxypeptidase B-like [Clavelina lepadiformis]|uniref:carboxypeptidase B-like n=1 Tax=Clavelina lepadiformis TaxID=159417 RepID=UPI00404310E7